jgi:GTP:adenosylcobinamide-phosphate guanylyltransferase
MRVALFLQVIRTAGEANKRVVFLFSDTQIQSEGYVEDISNILNTYEVPNLMAPSDLAPIFENIRARAKAAGMEGSKDSMYSFFLQVQLPISRTMQGARLYLQGHSVAPAKLTSRTSKRRAFHTRCSLRQEELK